jgi:pyruvate dehydrogenase E2 component (dihydrolipoamide acetyltransferase)
MAVAIKMPKMSDTMTEGVVRKWNFKLGDTVKSGDILAEVETDKATMDLENYEKGTILHFAINEGDAAPVDGIIAIVGKAGEDFSALLSGAAPTPQASESKTDATVASKVESVAAAVAVPVNNSSIDGRIIASPLAKKLATEKGIDIGSVAGSGENGRVVKSDIENFKTSTSSAAASNNSYVAGVESFEEINVSQMRKVIAGRLAESKFTAPHFYLTMEINMDKALAARVAMNASGEVKVSVNDMIVKASALALRKHPWVNASWLGTKIRFNHHIHIGVAMAVEDGLLVPVVRFADQKSLSNISSEVKVFNSKAKDKKLQPADWAGNTFTISNLGMFGIEEFTAIINPPDACILAVGGVKETVGSKFLNTLKELLEEPVKMLV